MTDQPPEPLAARFQREFFQTLTETGTVLESELRGTNGGTMDDSEVLRLLLALANKNHEHIIELAAEIERGKQP
jgi:hypothetical protein